MSTSFSGCLSYYIISIMLLLIQFYCDNKYDDDNDDR